MGSPCQWVTLTTEEVAPNHPQGRTPVIPILTGSRPDRPATLEAEEAVMGIVVEGARSSVEGLVDQVDPEDLLDFEPEEPDYRLLDSTDTTKVTINKLYCYREFRNKFRTMIRTEERASRTCNEGKIIMDSMNLIACNHPYLFYSYYQPLIYYLWYLCQIGRSIRSQKDYASIVPCESRVILCQ